MGLSKTNRAVASTFIAATAVAFAGVVQAQESAQLYGSARSVFNMQRSANGGNAYQVTDMASRFGMRGSERISSDLEGVYSVEFGYASDLLATNATPGLRHAAVGLRSKSWGTFAVGALDSGNPTGSPFYTHVVAIVSFAPGDAGPTAIGTSMLNARNRTPNSFGYATPNMNGFVGRARYYFRGAGTATQPESDLRSLDAGLSYSAGPIYAAVAYGQDKRVGGLQNNEFDDKFHVGLRYNLGVVQPYAMFGVDNYVGTATTRDEVKWWVVGARVPLGENAIVANYFTRDVQANRVGERKRVQLAYVHKLSRRTELSAYFDRDGIDSSRTNVAVRSIGTGIRHDF